MKKNLNNIVWYNVFEGEGDKDVPPKTYTQEDVDKLLKDKADEGTKANKKLVDQLKELQAHKSTSEETKKQLESRIQELESSSLTKEQQLEREKERVETELKTQVESLSQSDTKNKNRFINLAIRSALAEAGVKAKAFSLNQIVNLLQPNSKVVHRKDDDGNELDDYEVKIKFEDVDKKNNRVVVELSPDDVMKRMKELPEMYGNLFVSDTKGGVGGGPPQQKGELDYTKMTAEEYRKHRHQIAGTGAKKP